MTTKQVKFKDDEGTILGGILVNNEYIICGCCGGTFEVNEVTIIEEYDFWVDFSNYITD